MLILSGILRFWLIFSYTLNFIEQKGLLRSVIEEDFEANTCVRFIEINSTASAIHQFMHFTKGDNPKYVTSLLLKFRSKNTELITNDN